jgi:hypothetical protein
MNIVCLVLFMFLMGVAILTSFFGGDMKDVGSFYDDNWDSIKEEIDRVDPYLCVDLTQAECKKRFKAKTNAELKVVALGAAGIEAFLLVLVWLSLRGVRFWMRTLEAEDFQSPGALVDGGDGGDGGNSAADAAVAAMEPDSKKGRNKKLGKGKASKERSKDFEDTFSNPLGEEVPQEIPADAKNIADLAAMEGVSMATMVGFDEAKMKVVATSHGVGVTLRKQIVKEWKEMQGMEMRSTSQDLMRQISGDLT